MFRSKKKKIEQLEKTIIEQKELVSGYIQELAHKTKMIKSRDSKIENLIDLKNSIQNDLNMWRPLAEEINSMRVNGPDKPISIPNKGILLLKELDQNRKILK